MIEFAGVPKVALEFMNKDHEVFVDQVNALMTLLSSDADHNEAITAVLTNVLQHCSEHFAREEFQMQSYDFPPYPMHKGEHERVLREMQQIIQAWNEAHDRAALKSYVNEILPDWFMNHTITMDRVTAQYVESMGGPAEKMPQQSN